MTTYECEDTRCALPHSSIYRYGVSPSKCPKAYLPKVPSLLTISRRSRRLNIKEVLKNDNEEEKIQKVVGGRNRVQVGATNRWRLSFNKATFFGKKCGAIYYTCVPSTIKLCNSSRLNTIANVNTFDGTKKVFSSSPVTSDFQQQKISQRDHASANTKCLPLQRQISDMQTYRNYIPLENRSPTPHEIFLNVSQEYHLVYGAGIVILALDMEWELCADVIDGSEVLQEILQRSESNGMFSNFDASSPLPRSTKTFKKPHKTRQSTKKISLPINNPLVSCEVLSIALLSLYKQVRSFPHQYVINILVAAQLLKMPRLIKACKEVMLNSIQVNTVCLYHNVAKECGIEEVVEKCVSWLELRLIPDLTLEIYLSHLTEATLLKVLNSPRLFTFDEYSVFKLFCYWLFLKEHNHSVIPSWSTLVTWFASIPRSKPFLHTREGKCYQALFKLLRLNGITDSTSVQEMKTMNLLPCQWLLKTLEDHYSSIQNGGDMSLMTRFETGSIRHGFILGKTRTSHSEIVSLHGFFFELFARRGFDGECVCYLKRLRSNSSMLSLHVCERQTFSIRQDREVRYSIKVQWKTSEGYKIEVLDPVTHILGFGEAVSKGKKLRLKTANVDLYVSFAILFPPS